jgi:hypothetical protein
VVAVGPKDIVETVNTEAAVYDKTTHAQLALYHFESFWTGGTTDECGDPRAIYLPGDDRFAISCTDLAPGGPVRFAISASSDPTGAWYKYAVPNTTLLDQDKIEATSDKFIVAGNNAGNQEDIYVYNKSDVLSGVANPAVVHVATTHSNLYQATVQQTYGSNGYLVATYPGSDVWLATVGGTPAAGNVHLTETDLGANSASAPVEPTVPGGKIGDNDLDGRIYDAIYEAETSDSKPVIQFSTADQCGSPAADCVLSARIDLSGSTPVLKYEQSFGQPGWDYTYGAVGLNAAGQVFEAYSRSNASNAPGAAVLGSGFDVTLQPAQPGSSSCGSTDTPPCDERWGDYLSTAIDPSDPSSVWVSGLYQLTNGPYGSGVFAWGTIIQKVTLLPTTSIIIPANGTTVSKTATLDATATNATSVQFLLFGGSYGYSGHLVGTATLTYYGWLYSWDTTTVPNGSYALLSEAFNSSGSAFSPGVNITVNNAPLPTTKVVIPSNGATLSGAAATLDASASNATSVQFWLFGGSYGYSGHLVGTATLTYYGWLYSWNTETVANNSYALLSEAFNSTGSVFSSGVTITVTN